MKTYDYKDETKDVRGKVRTWLIIRLIDIINSRITFKLTFLYRPRDSTPLTSCSRCWVIRRMWRPWSFRTWTRWCRWSRRTSSAPCPTWRRPTSASQRQVSSRRMRWTPRGLTFRASTNSSFSWSSTRQSMWSPLRSTLPRNSCKSSSNCSILRSPSSATT